MTSYYTEKLSGRRLQRCYDIAPPRIRQYLEAEIQHVLDRLRRAGSVLELGCGYGRVTLRLAARADRVLGIDLSVESLALAKTLAGAACEFLAMDALRMGFRAGVFDAVVCVQNGVCSFRAEPVALLQEALRVLRPGGIGLFSTYADRFWPHRLAWFELQAEAGLVGPVDPELSGDGTIVCKDGFRAGRLTPEDLESLCGRLSVDAKILEVDGSSLFCEMRKPGRR
jgi:SAM-dependent methyltransferase